MIRRIPTFSLSLAFALFGFLTIPCLRAQTWRAIGPSGGDARALAIDPSHPEVVYLGTTDGHIFGSRDSGDHWELLGLAGPTARSIVTAIVVDPRDSAKLFAGTWMPESNGETGGVYLSRDAGRTWQKTTLAGHAIRALVQAPSDPDVLVAGALDGVFRSRDGGRSWEPITPRNDSDLRNFDSLAIDPQNPDILYAGTFHLPWKTVDGGEQWVAIHSGMIDDSDVLSVAVDAADPHRLFASACSGIYRSDDAGSNWKKIQGIPYSSRRTPVIRQDPSHPNVLYAGTTEGLWKTTDSGAAWLRVSPGDWVVNAIVIEPATAGTGMARASVRPGPGRVLIGTEQQGVLASVDDGEHFQEANAGFRHRRILSLAMDPERPGHIAAVLANAPEPIMSTEDAGRSWSPLGRGLEASAVRRVYLLTGGWWAALKSGGLAHFEPDTRTWIREGSMVNNTGVIPGDGARRAKREAQPFGAVVNDLALSDSVWFAATAEGLFSSPDHGLSWARMAFAPLDLPVNSVHVSRDGQELRIASSHGMVFSDDAGKTWEWHDLPMESGGAILLEFADDNTALAVSPTGLYVSSNGGRNWRKGGAGLPEAPVGDLFIRPGFWLVSIDSAGFYFSQDRGVSWLRITGLEDMGDVLMSERSPASLADKAGGFVYAGSASGGLYVLEAVH
jgi:photosystem II stability/assembly factor-like uncharacterized protein